MLESPAGKHLVGGSHVRNDRAVMAGGIAVAMLNHVASILLAHDLGIRVPTRIGGPLHDEEAALPGLDVLEELEQLVLRGGRPTMGRPQVSPARSEMLPRAHLASVGPSRKTGDSIDFP
jgi:hypothetical protein